LAGDPKLRWRMGSAARAKFEREYVYPIHAGRMQRALLETAGVPLDDVTDVAADSTVPAPHWAAVAEEPIESTTDAISV